MDNERLLHHAATLLAPGQILPASVLPALQAEGDFADLDGMMQALLPLAQALARPPISHFRVGAIGRARETGDLILGANVEFPMSVPADTIHAEQFLFARAYHLGVTIGRMAVSARPCGHCRQFMNEFGGSSDLTILDPEMGPLALADLLPLSFGPRDLGQPEANPHSRISLELTEDSELTDQAALAALIAAGERAHVPYGGAPTAVALRLRDGSVVCGAAIENAAYNPSLAPLQTALINLIAEGHSYEAIESALIGSHRDPAFSYAEPTARLLATIAPGAVLERVSWRQRASR